MLCIGLFGTCGKSIWRTRFMKKYMDEGITYFNPQVDDWNPEFAKVEAKHLAEDDIILFPVTAETYGTGSLAETGFSILQVTRTIKNRSLIVLIENKLQQQLHINNPEAYKESMRARSLVRAHLEHIKFPNVYIVESLDEMLELSLKLYSIHKQLNELKPFSNELETHIA